MILTPSNYLTISEPANTAYQHLSRQSIASRRTKASRVDVLQVRISNFAYGKGHMKLQSGFSTLNNASNYSGCWNTRNGAMHLLFATRWRRPMLENPIKLETSKNTTTHTHPSPQPNFPHATKKTKPPPPKRRGLINNLETAATFYQITFPWSLKPPKIHIILKTPNLCPLIYEKAERSSSGRLLAPISHTFHSSSKGYYKLQRNWNPERGYP